MSEMAMYKYSIDVFRDYARLVGFEDDKLINDIFNASENYLAEGIDYGDALDLLAVSDKAPESYKKFLTNFEAVKQANPGEITTVAEYMSARQQYKGLMKDYGLTEVATDDSADKFLLNSVSAREARDRIDYAYNAILNADEQLKTQLKTFYPSLATSDLVASVLGVGKTVEELQKTVAKAGIQAGAAQAGLQAQSVDELQRAGVSREQAAAGFSNIKSGLQSVGAAAARAGTDVQGLQKELEAEQFLGMASQRRKKLAAREQAMLSGQSGTMTGSLSRQVSGSF